MKIPIYQIDAFTDGVFRGNPAAVCPLANWLDGATMQSIAAENNLAETAFFVPKDGGYELRWFTPSTEVDLCGHATLASAYVIFRHLDPAARSVTFSSRSGPLVVTREGDLIRMKLPRREGAPCEPPAKLLAALRSKPKEVLRSRDYMAVYDSEAHVRGLDPDMKLLAELDALGIIVTAAGEEADFVSRFFAPGAGVPEDPATGSSHCTLVPYWSKRLGKTLLRALQVSRRGGELFCEDAGDAVIIAGRAAQFLEGTIEV